jgi:peptide/nickel transport system substrate-binding protein
MKRLMIALLALCSATAVQAQDVPKPGGTLNIGTVYITLSALSFDPADWNWKLNHDAGNYLDSLFMADLSKSVRNGGKYPFYADGYVPSGAIRGDLAESWEWRENPLRIVINLRKGVMFPDKPGVMKSRELVADDVVFSFNHLAQSPKAIPHYFDHVDRIEATGPHQVTFFFKQFNAEWDYRWGWGYSSTVYPHEMV